MGEVSLDDLEEMAAKAASRPSGCLGLWAYNNPDHPDRLRVLVAVEDREDIPGAVVGEWLRKLGLPPSIATKKTVNYHRRGVRGEETGCKCPPIPRT